MVPPTRPESSRRRRFSHDVCSIAFIGCNSLRLTFFTEEMVVQFEEAVKNSWHKGVESVVHDRGNQTHHIKLRGYPWTLPFPCSSASPDQGTGASRFLLAVLRFMLAEGWESELATSKRGKKKGDELVHYHWFFRKCHKSFTLERTVSSDTDDDNNSSSWVLVGDEETIEEQLPAMCGIDFSGAETIRVIEGCSEVLDAMHACVKSCWYLKLHEQKSFGDIEQIKLRGRPWSGQGPHAEVFLPRLSLALKNAGWGIYSMLEVQDYLGNDSVPIFNRWFMMKL